MFAQKNMIYESAPYHNAIFVGYDQNGVPRHAHKRGSGSQSAYKGNQDAACRSMPFTGMGKVTASIYLKRPSTC